MLPGAWNSENTISSYSYSTYQPRDLFNSGRLFFNSTDALVPQDTNGVADVYEYEPPNTVSEPPPNDSCTTSAPTYNAAKEGCVSLISSGQSASESAFADASENGDDVFFVTDSKLVSEDRGTAYEALRRPRVRVGVAVPGRARRTAALHERGFVQARALAAARRVRFPVE